MRRAAVAGLVLVAGCTTSRRLDDPPGDPPPALAVVNFVPDVVVDTVGYVTLPLWGVFGADLGNLWPLVWVLSPIFGPAAGIDDGLHARPFWRATFFYEMKKLNAPPHEAAPPDAVEPEKEAR